MKGRARREAEEFNRIVVKMIKEYWPDAEIKVYKRVKDIPKPHILIKKRGLKIPVEVNGRKGGRFYLRHKLGGYGCTVIFETYRGREGFEKQVTDHLRNYGASLFLVNTDIYQEFPISLKTANGTVVLSNFQNMEKSLDMIYDSIKEKNKVGS